MLYFRFVSLWYFVLYIFHAWNALWYYCVVISARGTRYDIIVLYFSHVERALALLSNLFPACVTRSGVIMLYISACGTQSGVIVFYFLRMERPLTLLCSIFCVWNALWHYCVIFSACRTRSGVFLLYFMCA